MRPVSSSARGGAPGSSSEWPTLEIVKGLHQRGFVTAAQLAAVKSGTPRAIAKADEEAYQQACINSTTPLKQRQSNTTHAHGQPASARATRAKAAERRSAADAKGEESCIKKFEAGGYVFAPGTTGRKDCAITSLLKDITEKSKPAVKESFATYLAWIKNARTGRSNAADNDADNLADPVEDDDARASFGVIKACLDKISTNPALLPKNLSMQIWTIGRDGEKRVSRSIGNGETKLVLLQRADRFEAVIPPTTTSARPNSRFTEI